MKTKLSEHVHFVADPETVDLLDRGAAVAGESRSELLRRAARREAARILAEADTEADD